MLDQLTRALKMEEGMTGCLIDLCNAEALGHLGEDPSWQRVGSLLRSVQADTEKHTITVGRLIAELSAKEDVNGRTDKGF